MATKHHNPKAAAAAALQERAMLIKVSCGSWGSRRQSSELAAELAAAHGAQRDMVSASRDLVVKGTLRSITSLSREINVWIYRNSLPWTDDGQRLLPSVNYEQTMSQLKKLIHDREDRVNELANRWPAVKAEAKHRLGDLYNDDDYPTPEVLRAAFEVKVSILPVPSSDDFRVNVGSEAERARLAQMVDDEVQAKMADIIRSPYKRINKVVSKLVERLNVYEPANDDEKAKGVFRDTLVENIRDLLETLPSLNITDDPEMAQVTQDIRDQLCVADAGLLRESPELRQAVKEKAEEILDKAREFLG